MHEIIIPDVNTASKEHHDKFQGVMVIAEQHEGKLLDFVPEIVYKGNELAHVLDVELVVVVLGGTDSAQFTMLGRYGANEIVHVNSETLTQYHTEHTVNIITDLITARKPEIVIIGATPVGRDFAPRVAKRLHTGLTADCMELQIEQGTRTLLQTLPTFGGSVMATIVTPESRPQMCTVRPGAFEALEAESPIENPTVTVIHYELREALDRVRIVSVVKQIYEKVNLKDAPVIVAAGKGIGCKQNMTYLEELARLLGGEVAGTRVACDMDWITEDRQVGQTGKIINPKVYFACGISGSIQHTIGFQGAELVVAINSNADAPIFNVADIGIVGDVNEILPILVEELKKRRM